MRSFPLTLLTSSSLFLITQPTFAKNPGLDAPGAFIANSKSAALRKTFSANTNCLGPTRQEPEWYHPLIKASRLDGPGIGSEGITSENYVAFAGASNCQDAQLLLKAYGEATPAGKIYAALCLQKLDPALANTLWEELKRLPPSKVLIIMNGCKLWADAPICEMASIFSKGKGWLYLPTEEWITNRSRFFIEEGKKQSQPEDLTGPMQVFKIPQQSPAPASDATLQRALKYAHLAVILKPNSIEAHDFRASVYKRLSNNLLADKDLQISKQLKAKAIR